ncbi:type IX secretion system membrane protein PorP/SprF [Algoriphagus sp. CAU 1675]|uniref:PorP/SprF family type IX secretion system membrane protein n=1 Tax=Algoriphagus sp. CAU 1675 TaxID=3032597 RepID=UPI0023DB8BB5|nr:type IX secretion system membrane protein PorP/SprF [Algoriphagus sp. CAU 1675]MDF2158551.1 type IX secretion system membrane protein PorP/SprF [Algoriphagus sp. CAU 1675]
MKKLLILIFIVLALPFQSEAQSRKYVSQFSHLQGYFNPSLTGYEGSMARGFVRNQWAGWEGTPKNYFISAELDFAELNDLDASELGKNAVGVNVMTDSYGAFRETDLILSYATRVQVSSNAYLRVGAGLNFNSVRLDGNNLTTEQANDPIVNKYLGNFANMTMVDFNLGIALTHNNYYLSYAVQNVNEGRINGGDVFMDKKPRIGIFQGGYRKEISETLSVAGNLMWRSQNNLPDNVEINAKAILMEKFWAGLGHRFSYANNFQLGFILEKLRVGYVYEMPISKSYLLPNSTHEFMVAFTIFSRDNPAWIW